MVLALDLIYKSRMLALFLFYEANVFYFLLIFSEDELNLLVIIVDTNPIWWGKQALKESQVRLLEKAFG